MRATRTSSTTRRSRTGRLGSLVLALVVVVAGVPPPAAAGAGWVTDPATSATTSATGEDQDLAKPELSVSITGQGRVTSKPRGVDCPDDCSHRYAAGTVVELTAERPDGWIFDGWTGDCTGTGTCKIKMGKDRDVHADFVQVTHVLSVIVVGSGRVTSEPTGIDCPGDCTESFATGTDVTLTAEADPGWLFAGWTGGACSGTGPCTVTMAGRTSVTATFLELFGLTVTVTGPGTVTSTPAGIGCPGDCTQDYPTGTVVVLTRNPGAGGEFTGWGGDCSGTAATCTLTMDEDKIVSATFVQLYRLTVAVVGSGRVTSTPAGIGCPGDCVQDYRAGTSVTLARDADDGWVFTGWSGACSGTGACVVPMTGAKTVTATFARPTEYTVSLPCCYGEEGHVGSTPSGIDCGVGGEDCSHAFPAGSRVVLNAGTSYPYRFYGWSGDCSGRKACTLVMDSNKDVDAVFGPWDVWAPPPSAGSAVPAVAHADGSGLMATKRALAVSRAGEGTVTSTPAGIRCGDDCSHRYADGTVVELTAERADGWIFDGWSGDCTGTGTCKIKMSRDRDVHADFVQVTHVLTAGVVGSGRVASTPAGIDCPGDCTESYPTGTVVTLDHAAADGWAFTGWTGACTGTGTCTVTMVGRTSVTATFTELHTLTVNKSGSGTITSSPAGISCGADCDHDYLPGTQVTLTQVATGGWEFTGWSGACTGTGSCVVTMDADKSVTATFIQLHRLTVTVSGSGTVTGAGISCPGDCTQDYRAGTSVTLTRNAGAGWEFAGWGGACTGTGATCTLTMNAPKDVRATFNQPARYTLTISRIGEGHVGSDPDGIDCGDECVFSFPRGTRVTLSESSRPRWWFVGWGGPCDEVGATCVVTMDADKRISAEWEFVCIKCSPSTPTSPERRALVTATRRSRA